MEENLNQNPAEEAQPQEEIRQGGYTPRPAWQVWAARIGLAVFILFLIIYYCNIFGGG